MLLFVTDINAYHEMQKETPDVSDRYSTGKNYFAIKQGIESPEFQRYLRFMNSQSLVLFMVTRQEFTRMTMDDIAILLRKFAQGAWEVKADHAPLKPEEFEELAAMDGFKDVLYVPSGAQPLI